MPLHAHTSSVRSSDEDTEGVSNVLLRKLFNGVTAITSPRLPRVCSLPPMFCVAVTFSFSRRRRIPLRAVRYALLVMMRYWPKDSECYCPECVFAHQSLLLIQAWLSVDFLAQASSISKGHQRPVEVECVIGCLEVHGGLSTAAATQRAHVHDMKQLRVCKSWSSVG